MSKLLKTTVLLCLLLLMTVAAQPAAAVCQHAVQIAESTSCVQQQIQPLRDSNMYKETRTVTENGDGTATVTFTFTPKCLDNPTPCGLATQIVTATVDCSAGTATCP
jgi:hypothetical protein